VYFNVCGSCVEVLWIFVVYIISVWMLMVSMFLRLIFVLVVMFCIFFRYCGLKWVIGFVYCDVCFCIVV